MKEEKDCSKCGSKAHKSGEHKGKGREEALKKMKK